MTSTLVLIGLVLVLIGGSGWIGWAMRDTKATTDLAEARARWAKHEAQYERDRREIVQRAESLRRRVHEAACVADADRLGDLARGMSLSGLGGEGGTPGTQPTAALDDGGDHAA